MNAPITCPKCGTDHPAIASVCGCGYTFSGMGSVSSGEPPKAKTDASAPPDAGQPIVIGTPFDIGKPLGTPHPVTQACPNCGSTEYKAVKAAAMVAFTSDRVCLACSTRYTPPTPLWARFIFGAIGLAALGFAAVTSYDIVQGKQHGTFGLLTPIVVAVVGLGCLYKAASK